MYHHARSTDQPRPPTGMTGGIIGWHARSTDPTGIKQLHHRNGAHPEHARPWLPPDDPRRPWERGFHARSTDPAGGYCVHTHLRSTDPHPGVNILEGLETAVMNRNELALRNAELKRQLHVARTDTNADWAVKQAQEIDRLKEHNEDLRGRLNRAGAERVRLGGELRQADDRAKKEANAADIANHAMDGAQHDRDQHRQDFSTFRDNLGTALDIPKDDQLCTDMIRVAAVIICERDEARAEAERYKRLPIKELDDVAKLLEERGYPQLTVRAKVQALLIHRNTARDLGDSWKSKYNLVQELADSLRERLKNMRKAWAADKDCAITPEPSKVDVAFAEFLAHTGLDVRKAHDISMQGYELSHGDLHTWASSGTIHLRVVWPENIVRVPRSR